MNKFRTFISQSGINQISWLNPLFLAVFPALIIIWLQPVQFPPFNFEQYVLNQNLMIFFADLENDGKAEKFIYGNEEVEGHAHIRYYNDKNQYTGQYNFHYPVGKSRVIVKPFSADFNNDGINDLVFISQHEDSLFLDAFDYKTERELIHSHFISRVGWNNDHDDFHMNWLGTYDANNDNIPELYFSIASGFAWYPRRIFRYDFAKDSLIASVNTGAGYLPGRIFEKNDSMLVVCGSSAYDNIPADYPFLYHDTTTWLFAFDKNLQMAFPPKHYGIDPSGIEFPIQSKNFIYYLFASNNEQQKNLLYKINWNGTVIDSIPLNFFVAKSFYPLSLKGKKHYLVSNLDKREFLEFDIEKFELKRNKQFKFLNGVSLFEQLDINSDDKDELLVLDNFTKQLIVYDENFKEYNRIDIGDYIRIITANFYQEDGYGEMIVNTANQALTFRYIKNPYYFLLYPLHLGIYIVAVLFVSLIFFFQNRRLQQRQQMEQQLANLQLQNLLSQLDPHFTFNVLNSVGNAIYKQDKEGAYDLFQRFTRIIRSSLMSSDKVFRSLKEELRFTQDYLDFQKLRFKNRFDYSIDVEKSLDTSTISILKMLIQGFAENAVKHAFYGVDYTGQITIQVFPENNQLKIIIDDDGIGIKRSKELKITSGTQKGELIIKEQIRQLNKLYNTNYSIQINDKSELDKDKSGTEVIISSSLRLLDSR